MAFMTLQAELPDSGYYVEFTGSQCEVWTLAGGNTMYSGPIAAMPIEARNEAETLGFIKKGNN